MHAMDLNRYLQRINYNGISDLSLNSLAELQVAHLMNVPFENLDIHNNVRIDLLNTFDKIVLLNRGGFCYELNGLFYELIKELGFSAKMVSARVYDDQKGYGPEFDHLAIIVSITGIAYLVDVGFGEFAFHPLKIELNSDLADPRGIFRIESYDNQYKVVKKWSPEGELVPQYIFSERERYLSEFYEMCFYHQKSVESHFTKKRICTLPTHGGRITLSGNILKITANESVTERVLNSDDEIAGVLLEYFKINL